MKHFFTNHHRLFVILLAIFLVGGLMIKITSQSVLATDYTISSPTTWDNADDISALGEIGNLTINNGVTLTVGGGTYDSGGLTITGTGTLTVNGTITVNGEISGSDGYGITFNFATVTINAGGTINGDGKGFAGGAAATDGIGPGKGIYSSSSGGIGSGAGYGGRGEYTTIAGGPVYGSGINPVHLGSGGAGGGGGWTGGAGGSLIKLVALGTITIDGIVTSNGANGSTYRGGGGSGGGVNIVCATIAGGGTITATGGTGGRDGGSSAGGGRISVKYSSTNTFDMTKATATSGTAKYGFTNYRTPMSGTAIFINTTTDDAFVYKTFSLEAATGTDLNQADTSDGVFFFHNFTLGDGSNVATLYPLPAGSSPTSFGPTLNLTGNLMVAANSTIAGNGLGYNAGLTTANGYGPGNGVYDAVNGAGSGGGHGGAGGNTAAGGGNGGDAYDSATNPTLIGSGGGGGSGGWWGGDGGGAITTVSAGQVNIAGTINMGGNNSPLYRGGGGAGGTVNISANTIIGAGSVSANGGTGGNDGGSGGGGGRIAMYYITSSSYSGTRTVAGGSGSANAGATGTNYLYAEAVSTPVSVDGVAVAGSPTASGTSPAFIVTPTEAASNPMNVKIQIATDSGFTANVQTFDQSSSGTGWTNANTTPYATGTSVTYTVQSPLTAKTTYFWRTSAKAPAGMNDWGDWSTTYSFLTNAKPQITSFTASQDSAGLVNISYTLSDEDDSSATVSFQYWDGAQYQEATTTTGEGSKTSGASPGTDQTGTWTGKTDYNTQYSTGMKIQITADDGNIGGSNTAESSIFTFDTTNPSISSFVIAGDATYTNSASVTHTISSSDNTAQQMQFSNDNSTWGTATNSSGVVTDSGTYETYGASKTGWYLTVGDDGTRTVYLRIKDAKGNTSTSSDTISLNLQNPTTPTGVDIIDVSTAGGPYRHFLTWTANADGDFASYKVQQKIDAGAYADIATITNQATDYYLDTSLSTSSTYYYKIKVTDTGTNTATSSEVSNQPASADVTSPTITNTPSAGSTTTITTTITWTTSEASNSIVDYGDTTAYGDSDGDSAESVTSHSVALSGLSPGTLYYFQVKSRDSAGNEGSADNTGAGYTFTTTSAPAISSVSAGAPGQTSATITWTTTTNSDSLVEWGATATPDSTWKTVGNRAESVASHSVAITGLSQSTTHYFQIKSRDSEGNQTTDNNGGSYYSFGTSSDSTSPTITTSPTASNVLNESAIITWVTDEASTTQISYSTSNGFVWGAGTTSTLKSETDYNHTVSLTGLTRNTAYYVLARSLDSSSNPVTSSQITFTTTGDATDPVISLAIAESLTETTAVISWLTDESATSGVQYGTVSTSLNLSTAVDTKLNRTHRVELSGLTAGQVYYFAVVSLDANNNSASLAYTDDNNLTFITLTTPSVSNVAFADASASSATISWQTNVSGDSVVEYGADQSLLLGSQGNPLDLTSAHSVALAGLTSQTTYYFRVKSVDANGNSAYSEISSFATLADTSSSDIVAPSIGGDSPAISREAHQATITWLTDELSNSIVRYGATSALGAETGKDDSVKEHSITLAGLNPDTRYYFEIRSKDATGNVGAKSDLTFTTKAEGAISNVEVNDLTLSSAIVGWSTNIVTSSVFRYGADKNMSQQIIDQSLGSATTHTIRLSGLDEGTKYYYQVAGVDEDGNAVVSDQYQFSTLPLPKVTEVKLDEVLATNATISWQTNVPTTSLVGFGTNIPNQDQGSSDSLASHKVVLQALTPNTKYNYQIKSTDQYGNIATSEVYSLTTKADVYAPQISKVKSEISTVGAGEGARVQAIITWVTDEPSTSQISYGVGVTSGDFAQKTPLDENYNLSHVVIIKNLLPSTSYRFQAVSSDEIANQATSSDYTILTPEKEDSTLQVIIKLLEETFSFIPSIMKK